MRCCLIADDEEMVRDALSLTVAARWPAAVIVAAGSFAEAARLARYHAPDLCLTDLAMPGTPPRDGVAMLRAATAAPVIVITGLDDDALLLDLIGVVAGFVPKMSPAAIVTAAIDLVLAGGRYIPPRVADLALRQLPAAAQGDAAAAIARLTPRQMEVLRLVAGGLSNRAIAERLGISAETVKTHVSQVIGAIGTANRTAAAMQARAAGLI